LEMMERYLDGKNLYLGYSLDDIKESIDEVVQTLKKLVIVKSEYQEIKVDLDKRLIREDYNFNFSDDDFARLKTEIKDHDLAIFIRFSSSTISSDVRMSESKFVKPYIIQPSDVLKRPEVGVIILHQSAGINKYGIDDNKKEYFKYLFLHEFTHLLGFIKNYLNRIIKSVEYKVLNNLNIINRKMVKSDGVKNHTQVYFGCPDAQGVQLDERENFEDLEDSHWSGRFLLGEYMTSEPYFADQIISEFTLLLLEDLGFYKTDKYTGGLMRFGKNQGCDFLNKDCFSEKPDDEFTLIPSFRYEFCEKNLQITCSSGRQSRAYCSSYPYSSMPSNYHRDRSPFLITHGREDADYCFVSDIFYRGGGESGQESDYRGNCRLGNKNFGNNFNNWPPGYSAAHNIYSHFHESVGDIISEDSFCALSSLVHKDDNTASYINYIRPTCYPMFCSETSLTIK
ncbi:MAG: hypothetical protein HUJ61_03940, partial [Bacilli bacterium]|nr:hypothetical protein [Bacilli bacterium]